MYVLVSFETTQMFLFNQLIFTDNRISKRVMYNVCVFFLLKKNQNQILRNISECKQKVNCVLRKVTKNSTSISSVCGRIHSKMISFTWVLAHI